MATEAERLVGIGSAPNSARRIQLAHEAPFRLGPLLIEPALRRIVHDDGREDVVEPRVMQVLVALIQGRGTILSRDDLIERCWGGRIVGEDAINRVMSRLRRSSETIGEGVFRIATITKVGYRLQLEGQTVPAPVADLQASGASVPFPSVEAHDTASTADWGRWTSRRTVLGALAAGAVAGAPVAWNWLKDASAPWRGHVPTPEAKALYDQGMRAQYFSLIAMAEEAEGFFRQAAQADPQWPDAWGSLAMSYRHLLDGETNEEQWRLVERTRDAANRALALDPNNAEALVALALIRSPYRRWAETEREYRPLLERFPNAFVLRGHLGRMLRDVGRYADALEMTRAAYAQQPFIVTVAFFHGFTLWGLGRMTEAEDVFERMIARWPKHITAWSAWTDFLTYTGNADLAAAFAANREGRPSGIPDFVFDRRMLIARALASRALADIDAAQAVIDQSISRSLGQSPSVPPTLPALPFLAAIGDLDKAFALLEGYFFDRGRYTPPRPREYGPLTRRESFFLFLPNAAPLWGDPRFAALLQEIGLTDYWRVNNIVPDYRRANT